MGLDTDQQRQWETFLKILQVREPKFHQHLRNGRLKEITKYNIVFLAKTPEDMKEMEVGLRVYHDRVEEFTSMVFGGPRGLKPELAKGKEWEIAAPAVTAAPPPEPPKVPVVVNQDQSDLLKALESTIRQKLEVEIREAIERERSDPARQAEIVQKVREDLQEDDQNSRLAVRLTLIADGDKSLSDVVMAWQQAKQSGEGGQPWADVKDRLLELFDRTIQLIQS
jgi:23S rRNA pseudoU1915 N3-methylase RlmH